MSFVYHLDDDGAAFVGRGTPSSTNQLGRGSEAANTAGAGEISLESIPMSPRYDKDHNQERGRDGPKDAEHTNLYRPLMAEELKSGSLRPDRPVNK